MVEEEGIKFIEQLRRRSDGAGAKEELGRAGEGKEEGGAERVGEGEGERREEGWDRGER